MLKFRSALLAHSSGENFSCVVVGKWTDFVATISNYACISDNTKDSVTLEGGNYPDFHQLPGDGTALNFADATSSVSCTPIV